MTPILEVEDLGKSYGGFEAVRHLSFALARGEVLGFLGPNGAGKTSTLRMILGILKPDRGSVRLFGQAWSRALLPRIGYLPEERGLYRRMKAAARPRGGARARCWSDWDSPRRPANASRASRRAWPRRCSSRRPSPMGRSS